MNKMENKRIILNFIINTNIGIGVNVTLYAFAFSTIDFPPNQQPEKKIPSLAFAQYKYASFLKPANISLDTSPGCSNHNNNHTHQIRDDNFYSHYIAGYARDAVTKLQYTAH